MNNKRKPITIEQTGEDVTKEEFVVKESLRKQQGKRTTLRVRE